MIPSTSDFRAIESYDVRFDRAGNQPLSHNYAARRTKIERRVLIRVRRVKVRACARREDEFCKNARFSAKARQVLRIIKICSRNIARILIRVSFNSTRNKKKN